MYQFIESIKLLDGKFFRVELHQERINQIFDAFFPDKKKISLTELIKYQAFPKKGFFKTRVVFNEEVKILEFVPYKIPNIKTLKVVETDIETAFYKSANRDKINRVFAKKEDCDDVLFVKNGFFTDTSYCNVALFDGENWFTPKTPLIYGTQRKNLINNKQILEKEIHISKIYNYQSICLFNAMIEFGEIVFSTNSIKM